MADYLTIGELAKYLRTTERAVRRWREIGVCPPGARIGARLLFERSDVDAWVASRREHLPDPPLPWLRGEWRSTARAGSRRRGTRG